MSSEQNEASNGRSLPGPTGRALAETVLRYEKDPLGESLQLHATYGDVVGLRRGPFLTVFLFHPDHARHVLITRASIYSRRTAAASRINAAIGKGLVTADKPEWTRQKKLLQPAFTPKALSYWVPKIDAAAARLVARWEHHDASEPINVHYEFGVALLEIVGEMLLGEALDEAAAQDIRRAIGVAANLDQQVPRRDALERSTRGQSESANQSYKQRYAEFLETQAKLNEVLDRHIARRRSEPSREDLLSTLIDSRDEKGNGFSDQEVRDQLKSLLVAGHDTTMTALSTSLYCLAKHPEELAKVRAEIETRGAQDAIEVPKLERTEAAILETLRLHPPVPHIDRRAEADDEIDGFHIPKNASVALSPLVVQRRADLWPDPERFDPRRFLGGAPDHYFPFGMGPRVCLGKNLALMEVKMFLCRVLPRFDLTPVEDFELKFTSAWTMHPAKANLPLWITPR